jgi:carbonic anhydrase/acetyltransferase-like protein (isoleucine patch superfamily)
MAIYQLEEHSPQLADGAWVADSADVMGRVTLGQRASVWYHSVLRADNAEILIGNDTNIQDGSVLHCDPGKPLHIGDGVTVGHQVMLHGCTVGDNCLIGIGAVVLNDAVIGKNSLVGAGSLVTEGKVFPEGSMILGSPAKVVRQLTPEQIAGLKRMAETYVEKAEMHRRGLKKIA